MYYLDVARDRIMTKCNYNSTAEIHLSGANKSIRNIAKKVLEYLDMIGVQNETSLYLHDEQICSYHTIICIVSTYKKSK